MSDKHPAGGPDSEQDRDDLERQLAFLREYRDWAIHALGKMPAPRPGSGVNLSAISERLQNAADSASQAVEWLTEQLGGMPTKKELAPGERPHNLRYVNMSLKDAILMFFDQSECARTEEEIIEEMKSGGAIIGRVRHEGEIKKSLETNSRAGVFLLYNGKYGKTDWDKKKFR